MPHSARTAPVWLGLLLLAGCASSALDLAPAAPDRPWQPNVAASGEIAPGPPAAAGPSRQTYVLPADPSVASLPQAPSIDPAKLYDLADLIDLAESTNPDTRIAWNAARNAALAAGIVRGTYLPHLTAAALGVYQTSNGRASALGLSGRDNVSASGSISAVSLQWLLFDFGERDALVESADRATIVANIEFTAAHQRLIHAVSLAFYNHAAARARAEIAEQSLRDAQEIEQAAGARFKNGVGTVIEVAQAKQATALANLGLVQTRGASQDAYVTLLSAMGLPPLLKIRIADVSRHQLTPALGDDVEKIVSSALARRPDVLAAYSTLKASLANVKAAQAERLPKFFVSATGAYTSGGIDISGIPGAAVDQAPTLNLSGNRFGATIMGGVTVPLYDGGTREAALAQARIRAESAGLALDRIKENSVQQIVMADNALRTSLATHDAAGALLAAAQTTYDAALSAYRQGVGSATDIHAAERLLLDARNASSDSYSAALSAAATLALATGALGAAP